MSLQAGPVCLSLRTSEGIEVPPTSRTTPILWKVHSFALSATICCASSRVGDSTRILGTGSLDPAEAMRARSFVRISMPGIMKARVLPVPVFAFTSTSEPFRMCGRLSFCTRVMYRYRMTSARALLVWADMGMSSNRASVTCEGFSSPHSGAGASTAISCTASSFGPDSASGFGPEDLLRFLFRPLPGAPSPGPPWGPPWGPPPPPPPPPADAGWTLVQGPWSTRLWAS
mmetsp:Transcript_34549/g.76195  ORF Transcript_34549/g.76195 Transcript_34549/m.76195 type:complete len:229 (-) Transcript_34549:27-713(-)